MACQHLEGLGWQVLDRNWRCDAGEIDVVAHDPGTDTLVFVEVKTRGGEGFGRPLEAITWAKQARLRALAMRWLGSHRDRPHAANVRIDGVGVLTRRGQRPHIDHVCGVGW